MSVGEVKAALRAAVEAARQGRRVFDKAASEAEAATGTANAILRGSQHEDVEATHEALAAARAEVEPTRRRFDDTAEHAGDYLTRLG
ncbi:hypothetical protein ACFFMR_13375 [Micromonospora andamanensis]|uniref:Uncharacterized protein n=1 Tax=Micromonospora andamanensis TaxID=1287068 RepID=A0ABQ4HN42_9ACTN|nr:hypothetical protein [Micromonospora andamanensis]GIJ07065.1 hypothetical protein Van01_02790 [Micromonospora andamanensis]